MKTAPRSAAKRPRTLAGTAPAAVPAVPRRPRGVGARGEETRESDWDILVLSQKTVTPLIKKTIRHALYDIEWKNGCVISSIIHETKEWESPRMKLTPLYRNIERDSVSL